MSIIAMELIDEPQLTFNKEHNLYFVELGAWDPNVASAQLAFEMLHSFFNAVVPTPMLIRQVLSFYAEIQMPCSQKINNTSLHMCVYYGN